MDNAVRQSPDWLNKLFENELFKFLFWGGINTGLTYLLYGAIVFFYGGNAAELAYTISFLAGIVLAFYLNSRYVFKAKMTFKKALAYPIVYLVQYLITLGVVKVWVDVLGWNPYLPPIVALIVTIPVTFLLNRFILRGLDK